MIGSTGLCGGVTSWPGARDAPRRKSQRTLDNIMLLLHNYARLFGLESGHAIKKVQQVHLAYRVTSTRQQIQTAEAAAISVTCPAFVPCRHWDLHLSRVFARDVVLLSQLNAPARLKFKTPDFAPTAGLIQSVPHPRRYLATATSAHL